MADRKKVAIICAAGSHGLTDYGQNTWTQMQTVYATLDRLGYEYDVFTVALTSLLGHDAAFANNYEFIVVPHSSPAAFNYTDNFAGLLAGNAHVPVFALGITAGGSGTPDWQRTCGVTTTGATSTNYLRLVWREKNLHWYCRTFLADPTYGTGVVPIATLYSDPLQFYLWKKQGTNGIVYYEGSTAGDRSGLIFLLSEAYRNGHISAPKYKILATIDIDDMPCTSGYPLNTLEDLQTTYSVMKQHGIFACWGCQADAVNWEDVTTAQRAYLAQITNESDSRVNFIEHGVFWLAGSSKSSLDTGFRDIVSLVSASGIKMGLEQGGYRFFPSNSISDNGMQLGSPEIDILSSPGNDAIKKGYGWKVARVDAPISANNPFGKPLRTMGIHQHRGIAVVSSTLAAPVDQYAADRTSAASVWSLAVQRCFIDTWTFGGVPYLHGSNFYHGHDAGDGWGSALLNDLGELVTLCSAFVEWGSGAELGYIGARSTE